MITFFSSLLICLCLLPATLKAADIPHFLVVGNFSESTDLSKLPEDWTPLVFKDIDAHTEYSLVKDDGISVVRATSNASSSGLTRKFSLNPLDYPVLSWRWKVANVYEKGDVTRKEGDDYPARIYITFAYDPKKVGFWEKVKFNTIKIFYGEYPPINAINYIWASKAPRDLITPNPYTDRVKMIVLESGPEKSNQWIQEKRNIAEDYRKAFGEEPPMISGIAIMTDSDNTGEKATAWYGDITFSVK
ncbi:MAG: DUF3047 domain-containing protein [Desulfobulbaceae bacterium]|nr:DUF3047 domain-containing protein [Desulfobulbaceae bacterium]